MAQRKSNSFVDFMGSPARYRVRSGFQQNGECEAIPPGGGWSAAQPDFTFTEGDDSFVAFETPSEPGKTACAPFYCSERFFTKNCFPSRICMYSVSSDHQVAHIFYAIQGHPQYQGDKARAQCIWIRGALSTLRLHHPDAARPVDLEVNPDTRRLAFFFKRLTLARLVPIT